MDQASASAESCLRVPGHYRALWTALRDAFGPAPLALVLFGSHARGDEVDGSDIDLLVVYPAATAVTRDSYRRTDDVVGRGRFDQRISLHLVALPAGPDACGGLWLEVATEGVVLFDETGEVSGLLCALGESVAAGGFRRRMVHGHPYWVREGAAG